MSALREIQSSFAGALFDPDRKLPADVTSHSARRPTQRFNVYRNNVMVSLADVLQAHYPVVTRLVGEEFFRATARAYIVTEQPSSPILSRYGKGLPRFLRTFQPVQDLPYLADVAQLEWLQQRAYHAADRVALAANDLAAIPAERAVDARFGMHPSAGFIASDYPIVSIWKTNTYDESVRSIDPHGGGEAALVLRPHLEVTVLPLAEGADTFVAALMVGKALGTAGQSALHADVSFNLQFALASLITAGAFVAYDFEQPEPSYAGDLPK